IANIAGEGRVTLMGTAVGFADLDELIFQGGAGEFGPLCRFDGRKSEGAIMGGQGCADGIQAGDIDVAMRVYPVVEDGIMEDLIEDLDQEGVAGAEIDDEGIYFGRVKKEMIGRDRFDALNELRKGEIVEVCVDTRLFLSLRTGAIEQESKDQGEDSFHVNGLAGLEIRLSGRGRQRDLF